MSITSTNLLASASKNNFLFCYYNGCVVGQEPERYVVSINLNWRLVSWDDAALFENRTTRIRKHSYQLKQNLERVKETLKIAQIHHNNTDVFRKILEKNRLGAIFFMDGHSYGGLMW